MPNHITNTISFGTDSKSLSKFQEMLEYVKDDNSFLGSIDFNKLIPMPPSLLIEAGSRGNDGLEIVKAFLREGVTVSLDTFHQLPNNDRSKFLCDKYKNLVERDPKIIDLGWSYFNNLRNYGFSTWYEWSIENWGTKWNAYDCKRADAKTDTLRFLTAWSSVPKIITEISKKFQNQKIYYRWADEDIGYNVGEEVFKNGEIISINCPEQGSRQAYEMSAAIMNIDLAEMGFVFSADRNTYIFDEDADLLPQKIAPANRKNSTKHKEYSR